MIDSVLFGMTCDGADVIASKIKIPSELRVGDWIAVGGMGAYTYASRSNFNGMKVSSRIFNVPQVIRDE